MTKDEIIAEIETLQGIVSMAYEKLQENQYLNMDMLQERLDKTCQNVADLSPEEAGDVRDPLTDLMEALQAYSSIIDEKLKDNDPKETNNH